MLATVLGQDLEGRDDDVLRVARRIAPDRVISTVDPPPGTGTRPTTAATTGSRAVAIDPDNEIITATAVSAPGIGDAACAVDLLTDILTNPPDTSATAGDRPVVYGDATYGTGELRAHLDQAMVKVKVRVQKPLAPDGHFTKTATSPSTSPPRP